MHGIVNKAIQGLVTENYGPEVWTKIKAKSQVEADSFISSEPYPDELTFTLATSASEELGVSVDQVLQSFGEYWILKTGMEHYGPLMKSGGSSFKEFLVNLPNFHSRVMLIFPNVTPPEFQVTDVTDNSLVIHYFSTRNGLKHFVYGLLMGIAKMFKKEINITIVKSKDAGDHHDEFLINWV
jgi:hypothetical protein